jgi:hypothetical protein
MQVLWIPEIDGHRCIIERKRREAYSCWIEPQTTRPSVSYHPLLYGPKLGIGQFCRIVPVRVYEDI